MIQLKNETKIQFNKSIKLIKENMKKGNIYFLWELKETMPSKKKKYAFFSIIKKCEDNGDMRMVDYKLKEVEQNINEIEDVSINFIGVNTKSFDVYLATEEEAKPYLKKALVMCLTDEPVVISEL